MTILITSFIVFFLLTDLQKCWSFSLNNLNSTLLGRNGKPVNILLILADDLGYGDTSVAPFIGSGILTPNLQKMASRGAVLTNFHASATTCTPSRAAILTGMYPWRLGIKAVFEYGAKTHNRDDWLLQVPTVPMIFSEASYNTFHSGKWHLGGMRNDDFDMRTLAAKPLGTKGGKRCPHPGPNQQGFQNYVSVLDGPGSPRQNHLQIEDKLYSEGCQHLLHNDKPITPEMFNITGYLSYCEAQHAMRAMTNSVKESKPFYVHLWFHAPHGPWEEIPGYGHLYDDLQYPKDIAQAIDCNAGKKPNTRQARYCSMNTGQGNRKRIVDRGVSRFAKYRSMISDMDTQIGMVLDHIHSLGIDQDTLIFFTSDNGFEDDAGSAGGLRGNKRYVYEGGIRVPAIAQWVGTIPPHSVVTTPAINTDLYATFLDAAKLPLPSHVQIDGISLLPDLVHASKYPIIEGHNITLNFPLLTAGAKQVDEVTTHVSHHLRHKKLPRLQQLTERLLLWHNDFEGPRRTVASAFDYKVLLDENEMPFEMFDLRLDVKEEKNLIEKIKKNEWEELVFRTNPKDLLKKLKIAKLTRSMIMKHRQDINIHILVVLRLYPHMKQYVQRGDEGYRRYLEQFPALRYPPSPLSDNRPLRSNVYRLHTAQQANTIRDKLVLDGSCDLKPCSCDFVSVSQVSPLPFPTVLPYQRWMNVTIPIPFFNSSLILLDA